MNIDEKIIKAINNIGIKNGEILKISLFGSRARCDNSERSDIDLAVYLKDTNNRKSIEQLENIETLLNIDITIMTENLEDALLKNIHNEEVVIYMGKFENKLNNFKKAVVKLEIVANLYDGKDEIIRDSLVQRFEFSYELSWKTLKEFIQYNGLSTESMPRPVFKVAFQHNIISNEENWLNMIRDRNVACLEYNEEFINIVAMNIKNIYLVEFKNLILKLDNK